MRGKLLADRGQERTYVLVFETGDEVRSGLLAFAGEHHLNGAYLSGIGNLSRVVLGFFDPDQREYSLIPIETQMEVLSLTGNIASKDDEPYLHAHIVVGMRDGSTRGGHLMEGVVRPTLEVIVSEAPLRLRRVPDTETGRNLIDL